MPIDYRVLEEGKLVLTVLSGHVTVDELFDHARDFLADARIRSEHRELADLSQAETSDVTSAQMQTAARMERNVASMKGSRLALYAPGDVHYGMSRMFVAFASDTPRAEVKIFRDVEQARDWLAIPPHLH